MPGTRAGLPEHAGRARPARHARTRSARPTLRAPRAASAAQPPRGSGRRPAARGRATPFRLPAPVEREVAVADGGAIVIAGGLDAGAASTNGVFRLDPATGALTLARRACRRRSTTPPARSSATRCSSSAAAPRQSSSAVQRFDLATHARSVVAQLAAPALGPRRGHDAGRRLSRRRLRRPLPRREIYRTRDGTHFTPRRDAARRPALPRRGGARQTS